jgi:hypothetical protein
MLAKSVSDMPMTTFLLYTFITEECTPLLGEENSLSSDCVVESGHVRLVVGAVGAVQVELKRGTLVHWYTGTLVHGYTGTLVHWYTGTLVHWYTGTRVHWYTGTLVHWSPIGIAQTNGVADTARARRRCARAALNEWSRAESRRFKPRSTV